jgi:hypothetical protein
VTGCVQDGAPSQFWEDDLGYYLAAAGPTTDEKTFWSNVLGSTLGQSLQTTSNFCAAGPYSYPALTDANIQLYGLGVVFHEWLQDYIYSLYCYDC